MNAPIRIVSFKVEELTFSFSVSFGVSFTDSSVSDVVIGSGSYKDPAGALVEAKNKFDNDVLVIASVCGTKEDPQDLAVQREKLTINGIFVLDSNIQAVKMAVKLYNSQKTNN